MIVSAGTGNVHAILVKLWLECPEIKDDIRVSQDQAAISEGYQNLHYMILLELEGEIYGFYRTLVHILYGGNAWEFK